MNTKIIFIGNYKGGVGKTTCTLNLAEYFHKEPSKNHEGQNKILVLDIDPQSSLSELMMHKRGEGELSDLPPEETLNYIFDLNILKIKKYNNIILTFDKNIIKECENYDFIPSSLFYYNKGKNKGLDVLSMEMENTVEYLSILKNYIDSVKEEYDFVLIDCPPTNNIITIAAFLMSDYYIIPTVLDGLSTNGVLHYINTVKETYKKYCFDNEDALLNKHYFGEEPKLIGIFYNLLRGQVHYESTKQDFENALERETEYKKDIILDSGINNYISIARSTENGEVSIERKDFEQLSKEIINRL